MVAIVVDYESPLARRVAGDVWSGLSRAALEAGFTKTTALWKSLRPLARTVLTRSTPSARSATLAHRTSTE
jgi:hypothetical protein